MTDYNEMLAECARAASVELKRSHSASRVERAAQIQAAEALKREARPAQESVEDSAATVIARQHGIPPEEVLINGRRYGDILAGRRR